MGEPDALQWLTSLGCDRMSLATLQETNPTAAGLRR